MELYFEVFDKILQHLEKGSFKSILTILKCQNSFIFSVIHLKTPEVQILKNNFKWENTQFPYVNIFMGYFIWKKL